MRTVYVVWKEDVSIVPSVMPSLNCVSPYIGVPLTTLCRKIRKSRFIGDWIVDKVEIKNKYGK